MYIPCQIVDTNSLESQASSGVQMKGFCCPCLSSHKNHHESNNRGGDFNENGTGEDPELVFSRHRAALIAGGRFLTNHAGMWNLQNAAPPLPQMGPPPLPPRKLSSFFPPMEILPSRKGSKDRHHHHDESSVQVQVTSSAVPAPLKKMSKENKQQNRKLSPPSVVSPPPLPQLSNLDDLRPLNASQMQRGSSANIACPYLSPIDVAATSWEWDFGNSETLRSHNILDSPEDHESGATDRVNIWGDPPVVKKGLLMQQREKMWSRWKERYFILTRDYLHCFRRLRNVYRLQITLSAMGQFIYKLRLANVEDIKWDTRRSGSRICLTIRHEPTILLRSSDNENNDALFHWYSLLQECICMSKIRRQAIRVFNSSSEEDTNSSNSDPSRFSAAIITNEDNNSHNSSYTLGTSSGTSGESSSQMDILEIYRRRCGGRQSIIPSSTSNSNFQPPTTGGRPPQPNQRKASVMSSSSCGFYLHEPNQPRPISTFSRPQSQLFKRFQLPALESESEADDRELHDILEGLPQRCHNPTREIEVSSHTDSHLSSVPRRPLRKENSSPIYDTNNIDEEEEEFDEFDEFASPGTKYPSRCESRITLREFVKTPWRSSSCLPPPSDSQMMRELRESSSSRLSAFPIPARRPVVPQRPMSSFSKPPTPQGVFGGRKVLPTPWTRNNPTLQIGKGAAFSRSNVIVCPSTLSADVTYLRRV